MKKILLIIFVVFITPIIIFAFYYLYVFDPIQDDTYYYVAKIDSPNGRLTNTEKDRLISYGRIDLANRYYDLGDYGYLLIISSVPDWSSNPGEEVRFGYTKITESELNNIKKNSKHIIDFTDPKSDIRSGQDFIVKVFK